MHLMLQLRNVRVNVPDPSYISFEILRCYEGRTFWLKQAAFRQWNGTWYFHEKE